jgi:sensor histidine kinase YesM
VLEDSVKRLVHAGGFLANDPNYAPFGRSWLRGITPSRLGLVELVCFIFAVRQDGDGFLAAGFFEQILSPILSAHIYLACSLPMLVLVNLADRHTEQQSASRPRIAAFSLAVVVGAAVYALGVTVSFGVEGWNLPSIWPWIAFPVLSYYLRALFMGALLASVLYYVTRETRIAAALQATRLKSIDLDRQMAEARLQLLQAQIEPHFLFNTLAHIKRLYLIDPDQGRAMLHNLSNYLHAALSQMRESGSTLGRELALARAYLNVLQARMGDRLEVSIAVPEELYPCELPPMMLPTLVENAIKHGIAPLQRGGAVRILATRDEDRLRVTVADNGVGFQGFSGGGVGLANTRARLSAMYGAQGLLTFAANPVRGVTVSIELPCVMPPARGAAAA